MIKKMPVKKNFDKLSILILLLFIFFFSLRVIYPSADPPINLSNSAGYFFDGSSNGHNARNKALFGEWKSDNWNPMLYSPVFSYLQHLIFSAVGVGFVQQRILPIAFSFLTLIFTYLLVKENFDRKHALLATLFLGFNYTFIMYNRLALFENQMIFFMILTLYLWQRAVRRDSILYFFLSGMSCFLVYVSKNISAYFELAAFSSLFFFLVIQHRQNLRKYIPFVLSFSTGAALVFMVWLIVFYIPNYSEISYVASNYLNVMMPHSFKQIESNLLSEPLFYNLKEMPFIFISAFFFILLLLFGLFKKPSEVDSLDFFVFSWLLIGTCFLAVFNERPVRYYVPFIPPLCILAARGLMQLKSASFIKKETLARPKSYLVLFIWSVIFIYTIVMPYTYGLFPENVNKYRALALSLLVSALATGLLWLFLRSYRKEQIEFPKSLTLSIFILMIFFFIIKNGTNYFRWVRSPFYILSSISKKLNRTLDNATILGKGSVAITIENRHKPIEGGGFTGDDSDIFKKHNITHLFLTPYGGELSRYKRDYPDIMKKAKLIDVYYIWKINFLLYSLLEEDDANIERPLFTYEAERLARQAGEVRFDKDASNFKALYGAVKKDISAFLVFGKYQEYPSGDYLAIFRLKVEDNTNNQEVATIDISADRGKTIIAKMPVYGKAFDNNNIYQEFDLPFSLKEPKKLEFRVYFHDTVDLWVDNILIYDQAKN